MNIRRIVTMSLLASGLVAALWLPSCGSGERREIIQNKGSDTLLEVAMAWSEAYEDEGVSVSVQGGGSGTGVTGLINGTVDIANSSRAMKPREIKLAREKGFEPVKHVVGYDALAVYVHKDNPIESLSISQLAEIFGEGGRITKWSDLGIKVPGNHDEIRRVGRQNSSGSYAYFRKAILGQREFKLNSNDLHGSKDVVEQVGETRTAIGYSGMAYANSHVRMVPIKKDAESKAVAPSVASALDGSYPIARPLLMYTAGEPEGRIKKFMDWVKGPRGQAILQELKYAPIKQ